VGGESSKLGVESSKLKAESSKVKAESSMLVELLGSEDFLIGQEGICFFILL
jgi:hypothetical protein